MLDRLLALYEPEIFKHFQDHGIQASYYSSSWFITLHTNAISGQMSD